MSDAHPYVKEPPDPRFRVLRRFNSEDGRRLAGRRDRMAPFWDHWFPTDTLPDRFGRALCARYAVDIKEFCESFEFFERVRKAVRRPVVVDLCCGHGLTGVLFALFERSVERVVLVDRQCPTTHARIMAAAADVAPWVAAKVEFCLVGVDHFSPPPDAGFMGVHACGKRTDLCLDMAIRTQGPVAVMPCCHTVKPYGDRPKAFDQAIGRHLAIDIDRTYRLRAAGYRVRWTAVPRAVTKMNRIIVGSPS